MTTIRQIIQDAYNEANIVAIDDIPDANQFDLGLRRLQNLYLSLLGFELGEPLLPVNYGKANLGNSYAIDEDKSSYIDSKYIPANTQLVFNLDASKTLYLPPNPADGARFGIIDNGNNLATYPVVINANGRQIELGSSITLNTNGINRQWFYRRDLGNWVRVTDLITTDPSPLPEEFDDLLITLLALRINNRFGAESDPSMIEVLKRMRSQLRARYKQVKKSKSELGLYKLTNYRYYWSQDDFDNGKMNYD